MCGQRGIIILVEKRGRGCEKKRIESEICDLLAH